jgi:formate dehydrogenase subunit gamma
MWFPDTFGRSIVSTGLVIHDIAALVMLGGFVVHIYESTAQQPGTFGAMIRGTVSNRWAWTHHPGWYRQVTRRVPRGDYERALQQQQRDHSSARPQSS